jgi:RNA polymerase primary sigma factor
MTTESEEHQLADYLTTLATVPPLTKIEEADLWQQIETRRKRLIEGYLHLVVSIADRYLSSGLSKLELYQEGNVGLIVAVRRFGGPSEDFAAFAESYIEMSINRAITDAQTKPETH